MIRWFLRTEARTVAGAMIVCVLAMTGLALLLARVTNTEYERCVYAGGAWGIVRERVTYSTTTTGSSLRTTTTPHTVRDYGCFEKGAPILFHRDRGR